MTLQGYREIVGDAKFFGLADTLLDEYRYGNISTQEFIAEAKKASGSQGRETQQAGPVLPAVALRHDEADDPAGGLRLTAFW